MPNAFELDHKFTAKDFDKINESLFKFCKNEATMCIPVQSSDDDMILGDALTALEHQYFEKDRLEILSKTKIDTMNYLSDKYLELKAENSKLRNALLKSIEYRQMIYKETGK